jgi:hypothetical protein
MRHFSLRAQIIGPVIYLMVFWFFAFVYWQKFVSGKMYVCSDSLLPIPPFVHLCTGTNILNCADYWIASPQSTFTLWFALFYGAPVALAVLLYFIRTMYMYIYKCS